MIAVKAQHMPISLDKVRVLQRKLYVAAKKDPNRTFGILYEKIHRMDILERSWIKCAVIEEVPVLIGNQ